MKLYAWNLNILINQCHPQLIKLNFKKRIYSTETPGSKQQNLPSPFHPLSSGTPGPLFKRFWVLPCLWTAFSAPLCALTALEVLQNLLFVFLHAAPRTRKQEAPLGYSGNQKTSQFPSHLPRWACLVALLVCTGCCPPSAGVPASSSSRPMAGESVPWGWRAKAMFETTRKKLVLVFYLIPFWNLIPPFIAALFLYLVHRTQLEGLSPSLQNSGKQWQDKQLQGKRTSGVGHLAR